jgi:hypothetical protein
MKLKLSRLVAGVLLTAVTVVAQATFGTLTAEGDFAFDHGKFADAEKAYVEALKQLRKTPEATSREAARAGAGASNELLKFTAASVVYVHSCVR